MLLNFLLPVKVVVWNGQQKIGVALVISVERRIISDKLLILKAAYISAENNRIIQTGLLIFNSDFC